LLKLRSEKDRVENMYFRTYGYQEEIARIKTLRLK